MKKIQILLFVLCLSILSQAQVGVYKSSGYGAVEKQKKPRKPLPTAMIGLSGGFGVTANQYVVYPNGAFGFDFAISASPHWALGLFTQWGILENFSFGAQIVNGNFANDKSAFVWGIGMAMNSRGSSHGERHYNSYYVEYQVATDSYTRNGITTQRWIYYNHDGISIGPAVQLGFTTPKHFYMLFDVSIFPYMYSKILDRYEQDGDIWYGAQVQEQTAATMTLSFGYAFSVKPKKKVQDKTDATDFQ